MGVNGAQYYPAQNYSDKLKYNKINQCHTLLINSAKKLRSRKYSINGIFITSDL